MVLPTVKLSRVYEMKPKLSYTETVATGVPIYEKPPEKYSAHRIMLDPKIDKHRIAVRRPLDVPYSSTLW